MQHPTTQDFVQESERRIQAMALVLSGEDLVRFYLSDEYHRLRDSLSRAMPSVN